MFAALDEHDRKQRRPPKHNVVFSMIAYVVICRQLQSQSVQNTGPPEITIPSSVSIDQSASPNRK